ncbi:MAG: DUF4143 domain-containing protein, partial [Deltaproteobacteria bacterium]|nr:DUF4143 domain-containing protein [Deltaproteobacteria bacterium]
FWENFIVTERLKKCAYQNVSCSHYFWRTYDGQEIDLIEEREGRLFGYEVKWSGKKGSKLPKDWFNTYENAEFKVINTGNYLDFVL